MTGVRIDKNKHVTRSKQLMVIGRHDQTLSLSILGKRSADDILKYFSYFTQK